MRTAKQSKLAIIDLASKIGSEIEADAQTLLSGAHADDIRALALPYPLDSGRMMHRTKLQGEESFG
jgi:hypothetical protein